MAKKHVEAVPITSEMVEPFFAMSIGRMWARCEEAKKSTAAYPELELQDACTNLWWTVDALNRLIIGFSTATHASVALSNEMQYIAKYIKDAIGICPISDDHYMFDFDKGRG